MSAINNFAKSGFWDYRNTLVPAIACAPLVYEGGRLVKNVVQNPSVIKEKLLSAKDRLIQSFTTQPGEERTAAVCRIAKNIFIGLCCLALMGGACYASAVLLPSALAVTTAISAVFMIGKLFINAGEYKKQLIEAFTAKEGEDPVVAKKRIAINILKAVALTVTTIAAAAIGAYILMPMIQHGFTFAVSLPFQTKGVVFAEYAAVGAVHLSLAAYKWKKGEKLQSLFHLFAGAMSFIFPVKYLLSPGPMRLHHSFSGLLLMALPCRPLQMFGSVVAFDSALYFLEPLRGYVGVVGQRLKFIEYDFINNVADNYSLFAGTMAGALIAENLNSNLERDIGKKKAADVPSV